MTEQAEQNAEQYGLLALENNPESPVALALLASIRLSQTRNDEAITLLKQSLSKWYGNSTVKPPSYEDRLHLVRLLIEVEMYDKALEVLETLEREDEDNVELWYYYTVAYYSGSNDSWEENWKNARECADICLKLYERRLRRGGFLLIRMRMKKGRNGKILIVMLRWKTRIDHGGIFLRPRLIYHVDFSSSTVLYLSVFDSVSD